DERPGEGKGGEQADGVDECGEAQCHDAVQEGYEDVGSVSEQCANGEQAQHGPKIRIGRGGAVEQGQDLLRQGKHQGSVSNEEGQGEVGVGPGGTPSLGVALTAGAGGSLRDDVAKADEKRIG